MIVDGIEIVLTRKNIKNLYIRVTAEGTVQVNVPKKIKDEEIKRFVSSRKNWILEHQRQALARQKFNPLKNHFDSLELWGKVFPIEIVNTDGRAKVELQNERVLMFVCGAADDKAKERLLNNWYRKLLKRQIALRLPELESLVGVKANEWHIKNMKTKWGTCNVKAKRIWLNLQLAKKPVECLDYVIVHELTHLLERSHNAVFRSYMDKFYPNWRQVRKCLNSFGAAF